MTYPLKSSYGHTKEERNRTGFSKNCLPFVNYDKNVDEADIKYF
jgi:hypothetical protein